MRLGKDVTRVTTKACVTTKTFCPDTQAGKKQRCIRMGTPRKTLTTVFLSSLQKPSGRRADVDPLPWEKFSNVSRTVWFLPRFPQWE